jgi:hypothetical protein
MANLRHAIEVEARLVAMRAVTIDPAEKSHRIAFDAGQFCHASDERCAFRLVESSVKQL